MTPIIIFILAAMLVITVLLTGYYDDQKRERNASVALVKSGRIISFPEARKLGGEGRGKIYRNQTSLPGKWWFIPQQETDDSRDFWQFVKNQGKMIHPITNQIDAELQSLLEVVDLNEPF